MYYRVSDNNSSSCNKNSNCDECVGTLADSSSCVWCTSTSSCLPKDDLNDECDNSSEHQTCDSTYYITIFVIIIACLIFLCCVACLLRKLNRNRDGDFSSSLHAPLLNFDRSASTNQEIEWMCTICGFDNRSRSKFCQLCGTSHEFITDYATEKQKMKKKKKKKDIIIPRDAQILESGRYSFSSSPGLTEGERRDALNYRRLNQLTLRQKGARRRRMWQRVIDEENGELVWVRVNFKEGMKAAKPTTVGTNGTTTTTAASAAPGNEPLTTTPHYPDPDNNPIFKMLQSLRSPQRAMSMQSASTAGRGDSFDVVLNSHSPGYTSYLDPSGQIQWEKLESGSMNVNPSHSYNPSSRFHNQSVSIHEAYQHLLQDLIPSDLQSIIALSFQDKITWFSDTLSLLQRPWSEGYIRLEISRSHLFEDSFAQLMMVSLSDGGIHRWMRVHFKNEPGIDAGGIEREWFLLITQKLFDFQTGLFTHSGGSSYHINPLSHLIYPEKYLEYYHFAGRLLAKAIMEQQQIPALLSIPLRKHLLGIPITFSDLEFVDLELYRNLCWLRDFEELGEDDDDMSSLGGVESLGLVFSVDYTFGDKRDDMSISLGSNERKEGGDSQFKTDKSRFSDTEGPPGGGGPRGGGLGGGGLGGEEGKSVIGIEPGRIYQQSYPLIPNGADITVTSSTKDDYLELRLRHRMLDSVKLQLESFLKGFYEVIPAEIICVFDYQELELLMCGLPTIDLEDWKRNTEYLGEYYRLGPKHKNIKWFWDVVMSYSDEERIRLLQFTTGCSRLPAKGFRALQSNDGNIRKFNIQSIRKTDSLYPRAHTCFNKLDLPIYSSKAELEAYLSVVINMEVTGFTID